MYFVLKVTLIWTIVLLMLMGLIYFALRFPRGKPDCTYTMQGSFFLLVMFMLMAIIFVLLGPNPIPFAADKMTYNYDEGSYDYMLNPNYDGWVLLVWIDLPVIFFIVTLYAIMFLTILGMLGFGVERKPAERKPGEIEEGEEKPRVGMAA
jgi:hypothetical protein